MATVATATETETVAPETFEELHKRLGKVPLSRIRIRPAPGMATEGDVIALLEAGDKRLCELVDGVLVEKDMSADASLLAGVLVGLLWQFVRPRKLGWVLPPDGAVQLFPQLVRIPDVTFIRRERSPNGKFPKVPITTLVPDLAIEVLSPGNTPGEMRRKLRDFFLAGIPIVWVINPRTGTAEIYTAPNKKKRLSKDEPLEAKGVLPGFKVTVRELLELAE